MIAATRSADRECGSSGRHHSFSAEFDVNKPFKLTGVVTKVAWANPHTFFYVDVTDDKTGKVTNWSMEMGNPNALMRAGWTRNTMKVGDTVSIEGSLARDGSAVRQRPRRRPGRDRPAAVRRLGPRSAVIGGARRDGESTNRQRASKNSRRHADKKSEPCLRKQPPPLVVQARPVKERRRRNRRSPGSDASLRCAEDPDNRTARRPYLGPSDRPPPRRRRLGRRKA